MIHLFLDQILPLLLALIGAPFLLGIINKTKAFFAGRKGPPVLQTYFDLIKLLKKGVIYSQTTTFVFRIASVVVLATTILALSTIPLLPTESLISFQGDLIFFVYVMALGRFAIVLGALDTGSSFEGMGASREVSYSVFAELALFLCLITLVLNTHVFSLSEIFTNITPHSWQQAAPALTLTVIVLFFLLLVENARIPIDDPNTHLELTMVHEVMILDHSGPDLAVLLYAASLKLLMFALLVVKLIVPLLTQTGWFSICLTVVGMFIVPIVVGIVESTLARLRLIKIPQIILGATTLAALGLLISVL